jgi:hypothetical protein
VKRVYHFLDAHYGLDDVERRRLKISRIEDLNDPFELLALDLSDATVRSSFAQTRKVLSETKGVLCFSTSWHSPLMWSHYADKHRGVCLGFDVPDEMFHPVRYDAERLAASLERWIVQGLDTEVLMERLLFTKFHDWKYEREVRAYVELEERDEQTGFYFFEFSTDLQLAEIILGPRCTIRTSAQLSRLKAAAPSTPIRQARLAFKTFRVVLNKAAVV